MGAAFQALRNLEQITQTLNANFSRSVEADLTCTSKSSVIMDILGHAALGVWSHHATQCLT